MTTIYAILNDQVLTASVLPKVACNNQNTVRLHVDFSSEWNSYAKSAVFYTDKDPTRYEVVLSSEGNCLIPPEVLAEAGKLFISVKGVSGAAVKSSTLLIYKVLAGTPSMVISVPTANVYNQLLSAYKSTGDAINTQKARIDNLVASNNDTDGNSELADMRTDFNGKVHASAGEAVRAHTKKLTRGRFALAALLPSAQGVYPSISTKDKTFTIGGDTLIISDRLPSGWVSLYPQEDNGHVTWGDELNTTAICFYYDISTNKLVARQYNDFTDNDNFILIATLRAHGKGAWANCSCPIYVDGKLSTEVNSLGGFAALLPPLDAATNEKYPKLSTADKTFTVPYDTLIIDPRLPSNFASLKAENGNNTVSFGDLTTSAICIYYDIAGGVLVAKPYNETVSTRDYLLLCTIRYRDPKKDTMVYASCPVWIDDRLSTDKDSEPIVYENALIKAINHRGYNSEAPENTLSAFKLSKKKGFSYVECDVAFTADNVPVLLHDATIDRTSNGTGDIGDLTYAQVSALDFGSWFSSDYAGEKIPTFAEFILLCRNLGLHPYIEIKSSATYTQTQIEILVNTVKRAGMADKVTWISFNNTYLYYVKGFNPKARLGYVVGDITENIITIAQSLKSDYNEVFIDAAYGSLTEEKIALCVSADIPLEVWTVNSAATVSSLDRYVSGFTSDNIIAGQALTNANL